MRYSTRSARKFNVVSDRGSLVSREPCFSSGYVSDVGTAVSDDQIIATALGILSRRIVSAPALLNPQATRDYFAMRFAGLEHEVFACLYLDNRHRVIACEELFRGTIDGASVHPREVVKRALVHNAAAAVIFAHNHPSGVAEPSLADELITRRLKDALAMVEIRVLDHLVVGGATVASFAERGAALAAPFVRQKDVETIAFLAVYSAYMDKHARCSPCQNMDTVFAKENKDECCDTKETEWYSEFGFQGRLERQCLFSQEGAHMRRTVFNRI